ncbi:flavin-binding monooxygenase-like-domain-containing protein [Gigaspora rosea]|uniref:Flavin-binding monooxygenase-like-domain-containing protein n=1 Tax=Gigaspora rosea TaxID=44941 RepID=A0A397VKB4_9GLOM|nr:flavin-binding monooxygenase-like-domain-containing protein [Gigaspora rosea]
MAKYVAIIGAGISGLPAIKQCLDSDLIPICFEQNSFIGGLWRYEDISEKNKEPYSTIYKVDVFGFSNSSGTGQLI